MPLEVAPENVNETWDTLEEGLLDVTCIREH